MKANVWFTSDLHLGHRLVAGLRGWGEDLDAYHEEIVDVWNRHVRPGDIVWNLGDVTLGPIERVGHVLDRLNGGQHHLIAGNHDQRHPMHRDAHKRTAWERYFDTVQAFARRRVGGQSVLMSHFPYTGEGERPGPDRYQQYRLPNLGTPLLHGHTHSERAVSQDKGVPMINVGWDAWGRPVNLDELEANL